MIQCVCLVVKRDNQLLLVQARNREKYYFPGGKIDEGETQIEALVREINEELKVTLDATKLSFVKTIVGPAYPQKNEQTELNGYITSETIDWDSVQPASEITAIDWIDISDAEKIAPAVLKWIDV